jgi:hypothetical protein
MNNKVLVATALMIAGMRLGLAQDSTTPVRIQVDAAKPQWIISKYLTGSHFVYALEPDSLFADGRVADWMRQSKVGIIRWPGGTAVQTYHWDHLNGIPFKSDSWQPGYNKPNADPANYMDLDKYIAFCRQVGAEPMVGVNIKSGKDFNREDDGLDEARRLVTYCKDKGYNVKFWYIGNEGYACGIGANLYPGYIDRYGGMIKSLIPDAVIIGDWKFGPVAKHRFEESVAIAKDSKYLDVMEFHEKWGSKWGLSGDEKSGEGWTLDNWRKESSLYNGDLAKYIRLFHEEMAKAGKPNVKVAFNEWGVEVKGGTPFDAAMVASDYMLEMFRNDVYQACYWDLNIGPKDSQVLQTSDDNHALVGFNPIAEIFKMYADALGKTLLLLDSSDPRIYGFATVDPASKQIELYLLNKAETAMPLQVQVLNAGLNHRPITIEAFVSPGTVKTTSPVAVDPVDFKVNLEPSSFSRIALEGI